MGICSLCESTDFQVKGKPKIDTCASKYINKEIKLEWQCKEGHIWKATPGCVKHQNQWCPYCFGKYKTIKDMQKLAEERGGKCVSKTFVGVDIKLQWQCKEGAWR